jgi:hypothetical protein
MGNPPREKQRRCGGSQVERIVCVGGGMKEIPHVIEGHDEHGYAAEYINGLNAWPG